MTPLQPAVSLPSESEANLAKETSRMLASHLQKTKPIQLRLADDPSGKLALPPQAVQLLLCILEEMARGNAVTLIPVHAELTTQEAADMLHVSRPFLIQLLNDGKIQYRKVGTHRRVRFESLMAYKRHTDGERRAALKQLSAYDQELGI